MEPIRMSEEIIELSTRGDAIRDGCEACIEALEEELDIEMSSHAKHITFQVFTAGFKAGSEWEARRKRWQFDQLQEVKRMAAARMGNR